MIRKIWALCDRQALAGFALVLLVAFLLHHFHLAASIDRALLDTAFRISREYAPQSVNIDPVVVGIDEQFVEEVDEPQALHHLYLARFLQAMGGAGASVVGIDLQLPSKRYETLTSTRDPGLDYHKSLLIGLREVIGQTKVVVVKTLNEGRRSFNEMHVDYEIVLGLQEHQPAIASAMFDLDPDKRIRRYPGPEVQPDPLKPPLAAAMSAAIGVHGDWSGFINYRLGAPFRYIPLQDVLDWAQQGDVERLRQTFGGKPVLLGVVLEDMDLLELPVPIASWRAGITRVPGVLAHAQVLRSIWNDGLIRSVPPPVVLGLCLLFSLFWFGESVLFKLKTLVAASTALLAAGAMLFLNNWWLPVSAILLSGWFAYSARGVLQGWRHYRDKQQLKKVFSGSVSPAVMEELVKGGLEGGHTSQRLLVCVLFADIRNFTTMCEHMAAEDVVALLNRYFARMVSVIHRHGGTVDKFIGDGLMAFFGAPNHLECPPRHALDAAAGMLAALQELNRELAAEGRATLQIGIGLHSGEAVIGQIGSAERHEFTAIGDAVNTASRIEGLCKEAGFPIVCSESVVQAAGERSGMAALGEKPLKGRAPVRVYGWQPNA